MYLIAASPLAKIFQPIYHEQLKKNPALILDKQFAYDITIPRSNGAIKFSYGKPKLFMKRGKEFEDDYLQTINWLIGDEDGKLYRESAQYGIVKLEQDTDVMASLIGLVNLQGDDDEKTAKKRKKLEGELIPDLKSAYEKAQVKSHERVMLAVRTCYNNIKTQFDRNKEMGIGAYVPSITEYLCTYVLEAEIAKTDKDVQALAESFTRSMSKIGNQDMGATS